MWFLSRMILAVLCYSIQSILYAKYSRKFGGTWTACIRNISLIFSWIPFLLFFWWVDWTWVEILRWPILLTAVISAIHVVVSYEGYRYLPYGISAILKNSSKTLFTLLISLFVLHEIYTPDQGRWLALIIIWSLWLSVDKIDISHLKMQNLGKWIFLVGLAWFTSATAWYYFSIYNAEFEGVFSAYLLEASIWVIYLLYLLVAAISNKLPKTEEKIKPLDVLYMSVIWILPLIWSISMTYAFKLGWYWLAWLVMIIGLPISFLLGRIIFDEKISIHHIISLLIVVAWLVIMKV